MKITREQVEKWNSAMHQGFKLDVQYALIHNEKCPHIYIPVEGHENQVYEVKLMYCDEYEEKTSEWGCKWKVTTGRQIPTAHISKWTKDGDFMTGRGLGHWIPVGEPQNRKTFSVLQKLTKTVNIDELIGRAENDSQNGSMFM